MPAWESPWLTRARLLRDAGRYGGHVLAERVRPPRATEAAHVPPSSDALTAGYLTKVLCAHHPGARVLDFELGAPNDGTTSRRTLTVRYNDAGTEAGLPTALFTKSSPRFTSRLIVGLLGALDSETTFYNTIRPKLDIEAPRGHHAVFDRFSARSMLLLEDVATTRGARFGNPVTMKVDRAMAESMVRQMVTYHGAFWDGSGMDARELRWMPTSFVWQQRANAGVSFRGRSMVGLRRSAEFVPPVLLDRQREIYPAFMRSLELNVRGPVTLLHSDVHLGNWYVTDKGQMGQYDWQAMVKGQWALDFSYAMTSALAIDDRRAWERDLIRLYLDELTATGVAAPSFDEAFLAYRQQVFHALVFWLYTIGAGPLQPTMQPRDICEVNVERMASAAADLDSLDSVEE
jgi:Phosphotransferase enzyme family